VAGFPFGRLARLDAAKVASLCKAPVATTTALQAIFVKPGSGGLGAIPPRCKDPFEHVSLGAAALTKQVHLCWLAALTFRETAE
jgi:hypothetical protein